MNRQCIRVGLYVKLKRSLDDLLSYLKRNSIIPEGSVFMTGTGVVPPDDFSLEDGDLVEIEIEGIGKLSNRAKHLSAVDSLASISQNGNQRVRDI